MEADMIHSRVFDKEEKYPVYLNVYDMLWLNEYTTSIGLGVYHSGIEVHGLEYSYGGHQLPITGIFSISPKDVTELGPQFRYRESILLGYTQCQSFQVEQLLEDMGAQFKGDAYHLTRKNCNHFAEALSQVICGKPIPGWVNRLAYLSSCLPFLERFLPKEWFVPTTLQHNVEIATGKDPDLH